MGRPREDKSSVLFGAVVLPDEQMGLDMESFDNVIRSRGVPLIHHRAMKCPVGLSDPHEIRRTHEDHSGCSNGFLLKAMGRVTATLTSNSKELEKLDWGYADGSRVMVTFPRFYDSDVDKRVIVQPFDRFSLDQEDILTGTWAITKRRLDAGDDRLEFPIVQVENLVDANAVEYHQHVDFDVTSAGDIRWRVTKGPDIGTVYTAWYQYRPYYICERLVNDLRLYPTHDFIDESKIRMERSGSGAVLVREYLHRTQAPDLETPTASRDRQRPAPDSDDSETDAV